MPLSSKSAPPLPPRPSLADRTRQLADRCAVAAVELEQVRALLLTLADEQDQLVQPEGTP